MAKVINDNIMIIKSNLDKDSKAVEESLKRASEVEIVTNLLGDEVTKMLKANLEQANNLQNKADELVKLSNRVKISKI